MHLVLTDRLTCPQCGPDTGLIVLAEQIQDRRVLEGALGCPGCYRQYPIAGGVADLRLVAEETAAPESREPALEPLQMAALMGITNGQGYALLLGAAGRAAGQLSRLVPGLELITLGHAAEHVEQPGVNRLLADAVLPLRDGSMRAVILDADAPAHLGSEALRVVALSGRLIISEEFSGADVLAQADALREHARAAHYVVMVRSH